MTATFGTITIPVELKVNVTAERERIDTEIADAVDALARIKGFGFDRSEGRKIIKMAATLAAHGVNEEMVGIFAKIAASNQITNEDLAALQRAGFGRTFDIY